VVPPLKRFALTLHPARLTANAKELLANVTRGIVIGQGGMFGQVTSLTIKIILPKAWLGVVLQVQPRCGPGVLILLFTSHEGNLSLPVARGDYLQFHVAQRMALSCPLPCGWR